MCIAFKIRTLNKNNKSNIMNKTKEQNKIYTCILFTFHTYSHGLSFISSCCGIWEAATHTSASPAREQPVGAKPEGVCPWSWCDFRTRESDHSASWTHLSSGNVCGKGVWLYQGMIMGKVCDYSRECVWKRCVIIPGTFGGKCVWSSQVMCGGNVWLSQGNIWGNGVWTSLGICGWKVCDDRERVLEKCVIIPGNVCEQDV